MKTVKSWVSGKSDYECCNDSHPDLGVRIDIYEKGQGLPNLNNLPFRRLTLAPYQEPIYTLLPGMKIESCQGYGLTKKLVFLILSGLLSCILFSTNAFGISDSTAYKYQREVQTPVSGFVILNADNEMLNNTQSGLGDIRIFDSALREIPYKLYTSPTYRYESYNPKIIDSVRHGDEYNSLTVDMGERGILTNKMSFSIDNSLEYISKVTLYASTDNQNWVQVKESRVVNLKSPQNITINEINYGEISYRYLKVNIYRYNGAIPTINGTTVYFEPRKSNASVLNRQLAIISRDQTKDNRTVITADTGAKDMSVSSLELSIIGKNYRREITIEGSYNKKDWSYIASGNIFNYNWDNYHYNGASIPVPNSNPRYYRLSIDNHDNEPLSIKSIECYYNPPKILFEAEKNAVYYICYGYDNAIAPDYDLSSFAHLIDISNSPQIGMGEQIENNRYKAPPPAKEAWSDTHKWILTLTLVILVAVMGVFMVRSFRREEDDK